MTFESPLWEQVGAHSLPTDFGDREVELVRSALNFHALDNPGQKLTVQVHAADKTHHPVLTDIRTVTGEYVKTFPRVGAITFRSVAVGTERRRRFHPELGGIEVETTGERFILVSTGERLTPGRQQPRGGIQAGARRLQRYLNDEHPAVADIARQAVFSRMERSLATKQIPRAPLFGASAPAVPPTTGRQPAVLFGLHWFELGGAERWAFESIRIAREAGLLPIVVTDKSSQHDYIDAPEMEGAIRIVLTHPMDQEDLKQPLLTSVLASFDVRGVFIHHCHWLYDRVQWLKAAAPQLPIVDSTHVLEFSGGGYVGLSARFSDFIDQHHVISPQLEDWLTKVQHVPHDHVVLAPLVGLSELERDAGVDFKRREGNEPFKLAFIGRFVRQKRPHLFLDLVRDLVGDARALDVRANLQGEGELAPQIERQVTRQGLSSKVRRIGAREPVAGTLADSDLLIVSSQNEGITLTTIEAVAAGVPVLSADVGSQRTIVPSGLLVPRDGRQFRKRAARIVRELARDEARREQLWREQKNLVQQFSASTSAREWAANLFAGWRMAPPTVLQTSESKTTAAVVVAYNRLEKLKTVIASIERQSSKPDWLVVVDNASTDGTGEYLRTLETTLRLVVVSNSTNVGGAGGFADGMRRGYELGADYVWIMDDDCYPGVGALGELHSGLGRAVERLGPEVPFSCSLVRYIDGTICEMNNAEPTWDWPRLVAQGDPDVMVSACSFVSVLFPRWVLERYGLPYREYFIWFDDAEYTRRLTRVCPGVQVLTSDVTHDMGVNQGVNFSMVDDSNAWKFAYGIRNQASYRRHHESFAAYVLFAAQVVLGMRRGRVAPRLQLKMVNQLRRGLTFNPPVEYPSRRPFSAPTGDVMR